MAQDSAVVAAGAAVRVLAATDRGARWVSGVLAVGYSPGGSVLFDGLARFGDWDYAPAMTYPVDVLRVEIERCES